MRVWISYSHFVFQLLIFIRWVAYSKKFILHSFDWEVLFGILDLVDNQVPPNTLSRIEEQAVGESFDNFLEWCMQLAHKQRIVFPSNSRIARDRLDLMLQCMNRLTIMPIFKRCCPFRRDLKLQLTVTLKVGLGVKIIYRE